MMLALRDSQKREIEYPVPLITAARLRQLVDEWIDAGFTPDGDLPNGRNLSRTSEGITAVRNCAKTNPCRLFFSERTAELVVCVGSHPETIFPLSPFTIAVEQADRMFTSMMASAEWKYQLCKCNYQRCGRYFFHPKPRGPYRHGTFCSPEHQRRASADALTKKRRSDMQRDLIEHAAKSLVGWKKGAAWQDDDAIKVRLAAGLSGRLSKIPTLRAGRDEVKVNWVTHHRAEIEERRSELVTLR
jgi:hypothetical protein